MKKISALATLMTILTFTVGCSSAETENACSLSPTDCNYQFKQIYMCDAQNGWAVTTENELLATKDGIGEFSSVKRIGETDPGTDGFLNASFVDGQTAYLAYFSSGSPSLTVEYTLDGGASWQQTLLNYETFGETCDAGSAYLSFQDVDNGYLLYCSTPGAGIMTKILLQTTDGGKSFSPVKELTNEIAGYPQGISFGKDKGYIAVSYHGEDSYLYKTSDGGANWEEIKLLPATEDGGYTEAYAPVFNGADGQKGLLVLKTVDENPVYRLFTTPDGGENWVLNGEVSCDSVKGYAYVNDNSLLFIDDAGKLYELSK